MPERVHSSEGLGLTRAVAATMKNRSQSNDAA